MPIDEETHAAIAAAVRDELVKRRVVERHEHDGYAGHVASKIKTLELLIAMKGHANGGQAVTHEIIHSILDERLAAVPSITHQLPPDVPTRAEVRELIAKTARLAIAPQIGTAGLAVADVDSRIDAALTGLQTHIEAMARQTAAQMEENMRQMYQSFARVETATLALDPENTAARVIMQREADGAGLGLEDYISNVHATHEAMKAAALSAGAH